MRRDDFIEKVVVAIEGICHEPLTSRDKDALLYHLQYTMAGSALSRLICTYCEPSEVAQVLLDAISEGCTSEEFDRAVLRKGLALSEVSAAPRRGKPNLRLVLKTA